MKLYVGTSGYSYRHWAGGVFYPPGLAPGKWLEFYGRKFDTVELNVTFYRLVKSSTFRAWAQRTPPDFRFSVKGSRFITHIQRLKDSAEALDRFEDNTGPLQDKILCVLWQLPPGFPRDSGRLEGFCRQMKRSRFLGRVRHAFEFRNETWFCRETYDILKGFGHGLCFADPLVKGGEEILTSDFLYLRFHGGASRYTSNYEDDALRSWRDRIRAFEGRAGVLFAYFNNDAQGFAPRNAQRFVQLFRE